MSLREKPRADARLTLTLPSPMRGRVVLLAAKAKISVSEAARQLLEAGLTVAEKPERQ